MRTLASRALRVRITSPATLTGFHSLAPPVRRLALSSRQNGSPVATVVTNRRWLSVEATDASSSDAAGPPTSPKVATLVNEIASLSLIEAAELTDALKVPHPLLTHHLLGGLMLTDSTLCACA